MFGVSTYSFRGANGAAEVLAAGHAVQMFQADSGHAGNLLLRENLLTPLDGDHFVFTIHLALRADSRADSCMLSPEIHCILYFDHSRDSMSLRAIVIPFHVGSTTAP
jgi:hypothetical protein